MIKLLYQDSQTEIVTIDATVSGTHHGDVEVTEHPVESGANIADHVRPKAETFTVECLVSNTPITKALRDQFGPEFAAGSFGRAERTWQTLRGIREAGTLITVVTELTTYENMVISSLSAPVDAKVSDAVRFSLSFKQIRVVSNQTVKVIEPIAARAALNKKVAAPAPAATRTSALKAVSNGLGLTLPGSGVVTP